MKFNFKKSLLFLLGISFVTAIIVDLFYSNIENAKLYALGNLFYNISSITFGLLTPLILIWIMVVYVLKELFNNMTSRDYTHENSYNPQCYCNGCQQMREGLSKKEKTKKRVKKK